MDLPLRVKKFDHRFTATFFVSTLELFVKVVRHWLAEMIQSNEKNTVKLSFQPNFNRKI
ncbi:hypothetical protein Hanom_Chr11g00971201 [Helianthus anomalus]